MIPPRHAFTRPPHKSDGGRLYAGAFHAEYNSAIPGSRLVRRPGAFTLIELLIVIAIMAILAGMLTVIMGIARKRAYDTATRSTLMKVDQAIRLFRTDVGSYPFQTDLSTDPNPVAVDPALWTNNLAYRLAWKPELDTGDGTTEEEKRTAYRTKIQDDMNAIATQFAFVDGRNVGGADGTHAFRFEKYEVPADRGFKTNLLLKNGSKTRDPIDFTIVGGVDSYVARNYMILSNDVTNGTGQAWALTKMAEEITKIRYLSGQLPLEAPKGLDPDDPDDEDKRPDFDPRYKDLHIKRGTEIFPQYRFVPYNRDRVGAIANDYRGPVLLSDTPGNGWRGEYLSDVMKAQSVANGPGDLDPTRSVILDSWRNPLVYVSRFAPGARGYSFGLNGLTDAIAPNQLDYGMGPVSRTVTTVMASDIRIEAAAPYVMEFELWSCGPDGRFHERRADSLNRDNVALLPYNRDLQ